MTDQKRHMHTPPNVKSYALLVSVVSWPDVLTCLKDVPLLGQHLLPKLKQTHPSVLSKRRLASHTKLRKSSQWRSTAKTQKSRETFTFSSFIRIAWLRRHVPPSPLRIHYTIHMSRCATPPNASTCLQWDGTWYHFPFWVNHVKHKKLKTSENHEK